MADKFKVSDFGIPGVSSGYANNGTTINGGDIQCAGTLTVDGAATLGGPLSAAGMSTFSGGLSLGTRRTVTISGGALTPTGPVLEVSSESGASDDLITLNGGSNGDLVTVYPAFGHTITLTQAGNLRLKSSSVTLNNVNASVTFRKNNSGNWQDITRQT